MVVDLQLRSWDGGVLLLSQIPWYVTVRSCEETQTENWNCVNLTSSKKNKKTNQVTMTNTKQLTTLMKYLTLCLSSVSQNPWHFWAFPAKYSNSATHSNLQNLVSPTPGVGWFLHEMGRYIYTVSTSSFHLRIRIYILQDHPIKPWKSMKIRISLFRHVSLVHLFSCFFGYNNVTYKNKQESSSQNYLGMGYEYPHNHFEERHDMMNPSRLVNRHC